jgi:hypothetical protein
VPFGDAAFASLIAARDAEYNSLLLESEFALLARSDAVIDDGLKIVPSISQSSRRAGAVHKRCAAVPPPRLRRHPISTRRSISDDVFV